MLNRTTWNNRKTTNAQCALSVAKYVNEGSADIHANASLETKYSLNAVFDSKLGLRKTHFISAFFWSKKLNKISPINNVVYVAKSICIWWRNKRMHCW